MRSDVTRAQALAAAGKHAVALPFAEDVAYTLVPLNHRGQTEIHWHSAECNGRVAWVDGKQEPLAQAGLPKPQAKGYRAVAPRRKPWEVDRKDERYAIHSSEGVESDGATLWCIPGAKPKKHVAQALESARQFPSVDVEALRTAAQYPGDVFIFAPYAVAVGTTETVVSEYRRCKRVSVRWIRLASAFEAHAWHTCELSVFTACALDGVVEARCGSNSLWLRFDDGREACRAQYRVLGMSQRVFGFDYDPAFVPDAEYKGKAYWHEYQRRQAVDYEWD